MKLTRKKKHHIDFEYQLEGSKLEFVDNISNFKTPPSVIRISFIFGIFLSSNGTWSSVFLVNTPVNWSFSASALSDNG
jgi:hypothetical protein